MKRDYLAQALRDAGAIELRVQHGDRWTSGLFDDLAHLRKAIAESTAQNIFTSLNEPAEVDINNMMTGRALADADIRTVCRLPFDFDPVRPKGLPSTSDELHHARRRRDKFVAMLSGLGWPLPAMATSGNGAHAVYRCRLPNTEAVADMMTALYLGLKVDFSDGAVQFDSTVRNPARIWRCYGTVNRKGTATPDRPHRTAVVAVPNRWEGVSPRLIEVLANKYAKGPTRKSDATVVKFIGAGDYRTLDVVGWFTAHGLYKRSLGSGKHAVFCPWQHEHTTPSTATSTDSVVWQAGEGWPTFHCSHSHCEGRSIHDVMALFRDADAYCARPYRRAA